MSKSHASPLRLGRSLLLESLEERRLLAAAPIGGDANLLVTEVSPTFSGFEVEFSQPPDLSQLNLHDSATDGPADVVLEGSTVGVVPGSLVVDESLQQIQFISREGPLPPDTYTLSLRAAANGFVDSQGGILDGAGSVPARPDGRLFVVRGFNNSIPTIYEVDATTGAEINSFPAPAMAFEIGPQGLAVGPSSLFYVDGSGPGPHRLYELDTNTGAVLDSDIIDPAQPQPIAGAAYLNGQVYLQNFVSNQILVWDPVADAPVNTLNVQIPIMGGLTAAADEGVLYGSNQGGQLIRVDPATGAVLDVSNASATPLRGGLAYVNGIIFAAENTLGFQIDPTTGLTFAPFEIPGGGFIGALGGDGGHLRPQLTRPALPARLFAVPVDTTTDIVEIDVETGTELNRFPAPIAAPPNAASLAFDGTSLWYTNSQAGAELFELDPNTGAILDRDLITAGSGTLDGLAALNGLIYIADPPAGDIHVFDPATDTRVNTLDVDFVNPGLRIGGALGGIAETNRLAARALNGLVELDPATGAFVAPLPFLGDGLASLDGSFYLTAPIPRIGVLSRTGILERELILQYPVAALGAHRNAQLENNFVAGFVVPEVTAVTVSVPSFVRGPGQPVQLPADSSSGIPLSIDSDVVLRSVDLVLEYDPTLLQLNAATVAAGMPAESTVQLDTSTAGQARIQFSSPTPVPAGTFDFVYLTANVPADNAAEILLEQHVLDLHSIEIDRGLPNPPAAVDGDGLHLVSYFGDVTGNGRINASDAAGVARLAAQLVPNIDSTPLVDPMLVADITGNGRVNAADASRIARFAALLEVPEIPPLPAGIQLSADLSVATSTERSPAVPLTLPDLQEAYSRRSTELGAVVESREREAVDRVMQTIGRADDDEDESPELLAALSLHRLDDLDLE